MDAMQEKRMKLFGLWLRTIRKRAGIRQREVAQASRLSVTYLSLVENGKRNFNDRTCIAVAQALQIDTDFLLLESRWARWDSVTFYALYPEEIMTQDMDPLTSLVLLRVRHMSRRMPQDMRTLMFQTINVMIDFASRGS